VTTIASPVQDPVRRRNGTPRRGLPRKDQNGDTLIEILIAVVLLSFAVIAVVDSLTTTVVSASSHRTQTRLTTLLKTFAEQVTSRVQVGTGYIVCGSAAAYNAAFGPSPGDGTEIPPPGYNGYAETVASVSYWVTGTAYRAGSYAPTCSTDTGLQVLTLSVAAPASAGGASDTITVIVRNPTWTASYAGT